MATPRIDDAQRRARLTRRHLLTPDARVATPTDVARALVAVHATDPASVHLSTGTRLCEPAIPAVEHALYEDRSLVRLLAMRRTMFVVPVELVATVQVACTDDIAARERRRMLDVLADNGIDDPDAVLSDLERGALAAVEARGEALAAEITDAVPGLAREVAVGSGRWATTLRLSSRVLFLLSAHGHIVRGRPRGTWLSTQYRWATTAGWLGSEPERPGADAACAELARRWLRTFGPGTVDDLKWWTGWTVTRTRQALAAIDTVEVLLDDGATGLVLADDVDPVPPPRPAAALLPALDATPMGWRHRDWYLGPHRDELFDRNGNVGPTVWWDGRIVGGWVQRPEGAVAVELLTDIGRDGAAAVDAEVHRLDALLGGVRVTPRFRTPLERRLSA
jgi:hypothetical protein